MSYHFLQGQEVASWHPDSSDGPPSWAARLTRTAERCCSKGNSTVTSAGSPSGMTSEPSTADHGQLTLCLEGSPARTWPHRVRVRDLPAAVVAYGTRCSESLARFGLVLSSRKTVRTCVPVVSAPSSRDLPAWGLTFDGGCWGLGTLVRPTKETGSGSLLPTPTANHYGTTNNGKRGDGTTFKTAGTPSLQTMARTGRWPTPTAACATGGQKTRGGARSNEPLLGGVAGGPLNPPWVEWLLGWPIGWTDLEQLEMDKFLAWLASHGTY